MLKNIQPKAHGAYLGAGSGATISAIIVAGVAAILGHPLPTATVEAVGAVVTSAGAFVGAYLMPLLGSRPLAPVAASPKPVAPAAVSAPVAEVPKAA